MCQIAAGVHLPFHRHFWRALVAEVLLYSALEIPEFQIIGDTLNRLLSPGNPHPSPLERAAFTPIQQAHLGARELTFGSAIYRPDQAGYNNRADVTRLAEYLAGIDPQSWTGADLPESIAPEERDEELEFAREWFPSLRETYQRARDMGWIIVIERIY